MLVIVDTNVPIVANGYSTSHASAQCVSICSHKIKDIIDNHIIILDDGWHIVTEYKKKLNQSGQPGIGDKFLKLVLVNQANPKRCERVHITPLPDSPDGNDFKEFPTDSVLANFDRSDRKFVAVALAHPKNPPILNATDSDWCEHRHAFAKYGIRLDFLCPEMMRKSTNFKE